MSDAPKPRCFVISPIGPEGSPERKRAEEFLEFIVTAALGESFDVKRVDQDGPGMITRQIFDHLAQDELVVADLSGRHANVMYELAIRHVLRKPYIQMMADDETLPFDIAQARTIFFDIHDLTSVKAAKLRLAKDVQTVMAPGFEPESPVSTIVDWRAMQAGNNTEKALAEILNRLDALTSRIAGIEDRRDYPALAAAMRAPRTSVDHPAAVFGGLRLGQLIPPARLGDIAGPTGPNGPATPNPKPDPFKE
jgi:hypothetical protein